MLNVAVAKRITAMNGAEWPSWLDDRLAAAGDDAEAVRKVGVEIATEIGQRLLDDGDIPGLHIYTLNRAKTTLAVLDRL